MLICTLEGNVVAVIGRLVNKPPASTHGSSGNIESALSVTVRGLAYVETYAIFLGRGGDA